MVPGRQGEGRASLSSDGENEKKGVLAPKCRRMQEGGSGPRRFVLSKKSDDGGRQLATGGDWWGFATPGMGACLELEMLTPIDLSRYGGPPSKAISPDGSEWCHRVNQAPHQGGEGGEGGLGKSHEIFTWRGRGGRPGPRGQRVGSCRGRGMPREVWDFGLGTFVGGREKEVLLFASRQVVVADLYHAGCFSG